MVRSLLVSLAVLQIVSGAGMLALHEKDSPLIGICFGIYVIADQWFDHIRDKAAKR